MENDAVLWSRQTTMLVCNSVHISGQSRNRLWPFLKDTSDVGTSLFCAALNFMHTQHLC
jgi:hypothetical protein